MQKILIFTSLLILFIVGCRPDEDFKPIGEPFDQVKGIHGTFKLKEVIQTDHLSKNLVKTLDVSDYCVGDNPMTLKFDSDAKTVEIVSGNSANLLTDADGTLTWLYDDNATPLYINLSNNTKWTLAHPIRTFDKQLSLNLVTYYTNDRDNKGNLLPTITYQFTFDRQ